MDTINNTITLTTFDPVDIVMQTDTDIDKVIEDMETKNITAENAINALYKEGVFKEGATDDGSITDDSDAGEDNLVNEDYDFRDIVGITLESSDDSDVQDDEVTSKTIAMMTDIYETNPPFGFGEDDEMIDDIINTGNDADPGSEEDEEDDEMIDDIINAPEDEEDQVEESAYSWGRCYYESTEAANLTDGEDDDEEVITEEE